MKFIYIDEVECVQKNPNFLGMGTIIIDSSKYHIFKKKFYEQFNLLGWDHETQATAKHSRLQNKEWF